MEHAKYVRFEGTVRHPRGHFPGIFVLANELAAQGKLTDDQYRFWRSNNDWYDANYTNPTSVDPEIYDPRIHSGAVACQGNCPTSHQACGRIPGAPSRARCRTPPSGVFEPRQSHLRGCGSGRGHPRGRAVQRLNDCLTTTLPSSHPVCLGRWQTGFELPAHATTRPALANGAPSISEPERPAGGCFDRCRAMR